MNLAAIGKFVKEKRKEKGLTQAQLAEKLSVSEKTVSKWECGKGLPDAEFMLPLCNELGISADELLSGRTIVEKQSESCSDGVKEFNKETLETISYYEETAGVAVALKIFLLISIISLFLGIIFIAFRTYATVVIGTVALLLFLISFAVAAFLTFFAKLYSRNVAAIVVMFSSLFLAVVLGFVVGATVAAEYIKNLDFNNLSAINVPEIKLPTAYGIIIAVLNALYCFSRPFAFKIKTRSELENADKLLVAYLLLSALDCIAGLILPVLSGIAGLAAFYTLYLFTQNRTHKIYYKTKYSNIPALPNIGTESEYDEERRIKVKSALVKFFASKRAILSVCAVIVIFPLTFAVPTDKPITVFGFLTGMVLPPFIVKIFIAAFLRPLRFRAFILFCITAAIETCMVGTCGIIFMQNPNAPVLPFWLSQTTLVAGLFSFFSFILGYESVSENGLPEVLLSCVMILLAAYLFVCMTPWFFSDAVMAQITIFVWADIAATVLSALRKKSALGRR
ncbi:MAG: helix-turn-helix transcriptional regulator [Clostridia bacterium]|nr:helix-turn-helix transcriptional regulator [Clostridia bacterium]